LNSSQPTRFTTCPRSMWSCSGGAFYSLALCGSQMPLRTGQHLEAQKRNSPPRSGPGGLQGWHATSVLDRIAALPVLGLGGRECQAQLFADRTREEPANGMRLPAGGSNQLGKCGAVRPLEQIQHLLSLDALAGTRFLLGSFGRLCALWRLLGWGGLLPDLGLQAATRGFRPPDVAFFLALGSSAGATAWAVASVSIFGVFIVFTPLAVITAVRTWITRVAHRSKRILQNPRKAMGRR
jgi:hypothetical protein